MKINNFIRLLLNLFLIGLLNDTFGLNLKKEGSYSLVLSNEKINLGMVESSKNQLKSNIKNKEKSSALNNSNSQLNLEASLFLEKQKYEIDKLNALAETLF